MNVRAGAYIIGFTGTRRGMTERQKERCIALLDEAKPDYLRHGAARGADDEIDLIAVAMGISRLVYPSNAFSMRVPNSVLESRVGSRLVIYPAEHPLRRNRHIAQSGLLIACPAHSYEELRSGTWSTIRLARKLETPIEIINPEDSL